jgi:hypothetical protein
MDGFDKFWLVRFISERLADFADAHGQNRLGDRNIGPEGLKQDFLGDELVGPWGIAYINPKDDPRKK